ncbi:AB-hydrolase YheT [Pseudovirgaria hyperparasitica]|uniref:alcohol O-acetyltransferase n=1 Tax=Pseudovirgaria hyperparasitica TaxID=470096 RepID=A0A6A6VZG3_9PEZI|nr:AB-hydrolase YheT [Pseudovirgaria hyperparasitica]KAF2755625.1 AB-hydrolase YheT [Pseudovirgaria hyperparasitica]
MGLSSWLGYATNSFHHSPAAIKIPLQDGTQEGLDDFCKNTTPPCRLNPLLFNGHLQTMWTAVKAEGPQMHYKRKIFQSEGTEFIGSFTVDFVVHERGEVDTTLPARTTYFTEKEFDNIGSSNSKPMLIALHGLSGGSYEIYLRQCLAPLVENQEWEACVVNSRGCAMSKVTSGVLYNARATWDVRQVVKWLRKTFPNRPLFGIGFSLGANIITNYIGEEGANCALKAAVVCSNPWDLDASSVALQRSWVGMEVYSKTMGTNMKALIERHAEEVSKYTAINLDALRKTKYLHEFDRVIQCPTWGYPTERAYYRDASSCDSLLSVRIPFLAINAEDDPIAANDAIPYGEFKQNPFTVLLTTSLGGHLSWFETGGQRWLAKPVAAFLNRMAFETDLKAVGALSSTAEHSNMGSAFDPMRRRLHVSAGQ